MNKYIKVAEKVLKATKDLMFADNDYIYDPEHKKHPSGGYHKTEKGWSKVEEKKEKPKEQYEIDWDKARNKSTSSAELDELAKSPHSFVRMDVANNPNTSSKTLALLSNETENMNVLYGVARHNNTPTDILDKLSNHPNNDVRKWVAFNKNTSPATLEKLSKDKYWEVKLMIARNHNAPEEILLNYAKSGGGEVMYAIANNPGTSYNVQNEVANYWNPAIRETLAQNPNTNEEILKKLSKDKEVSVRIEVAKNKNTSDSDLISLTKDQKSLQVRKAAQKTLDKKMQTPVKNFIEDVEFVAGLSNEEKKEYDSDFVSKMENISKSLKTFQDELEISFTTNNYTEKHPLKDSIDNSEYSAGPVVLQFLNRDDIWESKKYLSKAKEIAEELNQGKKVFDTFDFDGFYDVAKSLGKNGLVHNTNKDITKERMSYAGYLMGLRALDPKYNPYITLKTIGYTPQEAKEPIKFDITKLSPELREKVKDWDAEDIAKFLGWLKKQKEENV